MQIIENDPSFRFPTRDENRRKIWYDFAGKPVIGTSVFLYVPSYRSVVERIIVGYKYYKSLQNCKWRRPWGDDFLFTDPSNPDITPGVCEGSLLLQLATPNGGRRRLVQTLVSNGCDIFWYSAGHRVGGGFIYANANECYRDSLPSVGHSGMSAITPAKDGVLNPQKLVLAAVA